MSAVSGLQRAQSGGEPATGTHPCRVRVGEAGVEWGVCLYWVVRGWNPMWGWWEVCQRQGGVGWWVGEGGVVVGVWSRGVGGEGVPCQMAIAAR